MAKAFPSSEYDDRLKRVREAMSQRGLDAMVVGDPANMNWLTGFDAWSFYVPQIMVISLERGPVWIGREMDAGAAALTTYMEPENVVPYPEDLVQRPGTHASEFMAGWMKSNGFARDTIGYESDVYYFSSKALAILRQGLPDATWLDADLLLFPCCFVFCRNINDTISVNIKCDFNLWHSPRRRRDPYKIKLS